LTKKTIHNLMKQYAQIDYTQRPESYWDDADVLAALLKNVKGTQRRRMITDYWKQGRLTELHDELLRDTLAEKTRIDLGKIHPAFMGGEYLPDYDQDEAEIARIELASTTSDVISIRARRDPRGIRYRIVDEYESGFELAFESSRRPLTLKRLIQFIDGSSLAEWSGGLALVYNQINADEGCREDYRHFTRIASDIYPDLDEHYERVFEDWVKAGG